MSDRDLAYKIGKLHEEAGTQPIKAIQDVIKDNPGNLEAFLKGAQAGQESKEAAEDNASSNKGTPK